MKNLAITLLYYYTLSPMLIMLPAYLRPQASVLHYLGFGRNGVRSGTVASWLHSLHRGVIPRRGWFATLQRWGKMGGVPPQIRHAFKVVVLCWLLYLPDH
ncbi:hypothetical protein HPB50_021303 [Hyalomma asiaticum]|uniref:Uncharacterized protein n=1 Tax=Hyalomma asiaticum TaxID=266040 RepID=A0ACB7S734_HYAAI|nr:hypothetical protein HPB50_021303 [Hyalomma asiaticum]